MAQGFLITAPVVTGSHTDFSALLVTGSFPLEAIDGGAKSFPNGGGSLQAYTDKTLTTRLPISVVRFVTGASPDIQIRVLEPNLITGRQIYIRDDETQLTQPAVTSTYGRNNAYHDGLNINMDTFTDNSGGGFDGTEVGSLPKVTGEIGEAINRSGSGANRLDINAGQVLSSNLPFTVSSWVNLQAISGGSGIIYRLQTDLSEGFQLFEIGNPNYGKINFGSNSGWFKGGVSTFPLLLWNKVSISYSGVNPQSSASFKVYLNGVEQVVVTVGAYSPVPQTNVVGASADGSTPTAAYLDEFSVSNTRELSADYIATEYDMEANSDTWWSVGALEDESSTGVNVSATLGAISYSSQAVSVSIAGSVDLISTLGAIDYSSNNASVSIAGDIELTATLGTINYDSNNVGISLTGSVDITPTLGTINYSSNNANVLITSDLVVSTTLGTINYESNSAEITLSGLVDLSVTLGTINYASNRALVSVGEGQKIGDITAGFADNDISVKYKLNGITVNFK